MPDELFRLSTSAAKSLLELSFSATMELYRYLLEDVDLEDFARDMEYFT